jgi:hypothetical protein
VPLAATASKTAWLAGEIAARVGEGPFTADQAARRLLELEDPDGLIRVLSEALIADSKDVKLDELDESPWGPAPTDSQLASARESGRTAVGEALSAALEGALTRAQAGQRLDISPQAVSKRVAAGSLLALRRGREKRLPSWQFHEDGVLPGLGEVIDAWPGTPLSLSRWMTLPAVDLGGRTPAIALRRRGGVRRVLDAMEPLTSKAW